MVGRGALRRLCRCSTPFLISAQACASRRCRTRPTASCSTSIPPSLVSYIGPTWSTLTVMCRIVRLPTFLSRLSDGAQNSARGQRATQMRRRSFRFSTNHSHPASLYRNISPTIPSIPLALARLQTAIASLARRSAGSLQVTIATC